MNMRGVSRRALLAGAPMVGVAAAVGAPSAPALAAPIGQAQTPADFLAVGDGVTDDTEALNRALAEARVLDFGGPDKIYRVTGTLLAQQATPQFLIGTGAVIRAGTLRLLTPGHTVRGLVFEGIDPIVGPQRGGKSILVQSAAAGSIIEDCRFVEVAESAIVVSAGADRTRIAGCLFQHCGHRLPILPSGIEDRSFVATVRASADYTAVVDSQLLACDWGVYFRAENANGIHNYECSGNLIVAGADADVTSQGISNGQGRGGRIENNTVVGFIDNCIDLYGCTATTIVGNTTEGGKDGVFVGDETSVGNTITGNVFRRPDQGVRVVAGAPLNKSVTGTIISGNVVIQPVYAGIVVWESGAATVSGTTVSDNRVDLQDEVPGEFGIRVIGAELTRITGNHVFRSRSHGIRLEGADLTQVIGNIVQDPGYTITGDPPIDGVSVTGSNRVVIRDTIVYGRARFAVDVPSGSGMTVTGTRWRSTRGGVNLAASVLASDNIGW